MCRGEGERCAVEVAPTEVGMGRSWDVLLAMIDSKSECGGKRRHIVVEGVAAYLFHLSRASSSDPCR